MQWRVEWGNQKRRLREIGKERDGGEDEEGVKERWPRKHG